MKHIPTLSEFINEGTSVKAQATVYTPWGELDVDPIVIKGFDNQKHDLNELIKTEAINMIEKWLKNAPKTDFEINIK